MATKRKLFCEETQCGHCGHYTPLEVIGSFSAPGETHDRKPYYDLRFCPACHRPSLAETWPDDDGKLDVCVFKGEGLLNYAQHLFKVASLQHLRDPQIEYHQCQDLVVESSTPLPVHVDDEPFAETPVAIRVIPGALKVILPRNAPRDLFAGG